MKVYVALYGCYEQDILSIRDNEMSAWRDCINHFISEKEYRTQSFIRKKYPDAKWPYKYRFYRRYGVDEWDTEVGMK